MKACEKQQHNANSSMNHMQIPASTWYYRKFPPPSALLFEFLCCVSTTVLIQVQDSKMSCLVSCGYAQIFCLETQNQLPDVLTGWSRQFWQSCGWKKGNSLGLTANQDNRASQRWSFLELCTVSTLWLKTRALQRRFFHNGCACYRVPKGRAPSQCKMQGGDTVLLCVSLLDTKN